MANQQRPSEHEKRYTNGHAHDMEMELSKTANKIARYPELQGYIMLGAGAVLLLFSFGFFPVLKWAVGAVAVMLMLAGIVRSNVMESISHFIERFRK